MKILILFIGISITQTLSNSAWAETPSEKQATDSELESLFEELGSSSFKKRTEAQLKLFSFGQRTIDFAPKYANDANPERRRRAQELAKPNLRTVSPFEFIDSVREKLSAAPESNDLPYLQHEVQKAYWKVQPALHPLAQKIRTERIELQNAFYPSTKEKSEDTLHEYLLVLANEIPSILNARVEEDFLFLSVENRSYRLKCFDYSLGTENYELIGVDGPNYSFTLKDLLNIQSTLANGLPVQTVWPSGIEVDPTVSVSLVPRLPFYPATGETYGEGLRYLVNSGVTTTGDLIGVGECAGEEFFTSGDLDVASDHLRALLEVR